MVHTVHAWQMKLHVVNNAIKNTRMLQFFCALFDVVLGASVSDHHQHLGNIPPHAAVWGEDFLIDMFQRDSWIKKRGTDYQIWTIPCQFICWDAPDDVFICFGIAVVYLSLCFLLCSGQSAELTAQCLCYGKSWAWTQSWRHRCTAPVKPVLKRNGLHIMWTKGTKTSFFMACQMEHLKNPFKNPSGKERVESILKAKLGR